MSFFKYIDGGYIKSWCRVTEGRGHDIRNKDIIYPSVVLYNYKIVNLEIYPSKIRISFSFTHCSSTISNMLTATMVAFHSIWIGERASFSTPELTLWTPFLSQNCPSADFGVFKYAWAVTQKVWNEAENGVWGSRVLLLRHALPRFRVLGASFSI